MDCDDVMLLIAQESRTLTGGEASDVDAHVAGCEACRELANARTARPRLARLVPPRQLELPVVDPAVFEAREVVAAGGMGKITRAIDRRLGREVAIKEVLSVELRARFEREAAITARLQHPAIVPIYEAGTWPDGTVFYTMRLVPGGTLAEAIERATTLAQRLALLPHVIAMTEAVAYAHARRVIHRDLKPQNVLVGEFGETVVIDWGLARELDAPAAPEPALAAATDPELTAAGAVLGTPCFMPPEQARGEQLDARADVFSLGAILYHLLAGAPPYWDLARESKQLVEAVRTRPPTPISVLVPAAPADLRAIVDRAMARDPAARFPDAGAMGAELRRFAAGQLLVSRDYRIRDLLARWMARHRTAVAIGGAAAVVVAAVAAIAIVKVTRAREAEDSAFARGQRKLCTSESAHLQSPWDAEARAAVHRRFESLALPYVAQTLDTVDANLAHWTAELDAARDTICTTETVRPREQLAAELACLGERTQEARTMISAFRDADAPTVLNAVAATGQLAPVARCTEAKRPRAIPPDSPAVDQVRDLFARSHALIVLGKYKDALPLAEQALRGADAVGDPGLRSAALVSVGAAQSGTAKLDEAVVTLEQAIELADAAQDDRTRAQAWVDLVQAEYWLGRHEQVVALRPAALGAVERVGDAQLESQLLMNVGGSLSQLGKVRDAQPLFERAVALRRKIYGERDPRFSFALAALGNAYAMQGDLDKGIAAHRDALAAAEAVFGPYHPNVATARGNLASDYTYGLRAAEAVTELETALSAMIAVNGPKHRSVALILTDLGLAQLEAGQVAPAAETFERAEAMWAEINPKHPERAEALLGRYLAHQRLGKPVAVADLEAALELAKALPPFIRARVQVALAHASSGPRAVELMTAAEAGFATSTLPLCQRELAAVRAWLAQAPKSRAASSSSR